MTVHETVLVWIHGPDAPGITAGALGVVSAAGGTVENMEQVLMRGRLTLGLVVTVPEGRDLLKDMLLHGWENGLQVEFELVDDEPAAEGLGWVVTALGARLGSEQLHLVTSDIAAAGFNIARITQLARYPVFAYQLVVRGGDDAELQSRLVKLAGERADLDVALQREGLVRRAKRLVVLDVDSTLIQNEVIDLIADEAGKGEECAAITEAAMRGELDFDESLTERVALFEGLDAAAIERARQRLELTPGARTFVRTLRRLGFKVAIVSGGFNAFTDELAKELKLNHAHANQLEVVDGVLTGKVVGPVVNRERKAELLREIAASEDIPLEQTVAVGDGANDLDMLTAAGLGIAFNAKQVVRDAADAAVSVPYLDAILFVLGVPRADIEELDSIAAGGPVQYPDV